MITPDTVLKHLVDNALIKVHEHKGAISAVHVIWTCENWCNVVVRDGCDYIGGCCGNTSTAQDVICGALRDTGRLDAEGWHIFGVQLTGHEGFEDWSEPLTEADLLTKEQWKDPQISAWRKLGIVYRAIKDKLEPPREYKPEVYELRTPLERAYYVADDCFRLLRWDVLVAPEKRDHGNNQFLRARLLPALRLILDDLEKNEVVFEGFALTSGDEVAQNRLGYCVYRTPEDAQNFLKYRPELTLRPCRVTVKDGLTFTDV